MRASARPTLEELMSQASGLNLDFDTVINRYTIFGDDGDDTLFIFIFYNLIELSHFYVNNNL